jgi:hypothetical protein
MTLVTPGLAVFAKASPAKRTSVPGEALAETVPGIHALPCGRKARRGWPDVPAKTRFALLPGHDGN